MVLDLPADNPAGYTPAQHHHPAGGAEGSFEPLGYPILNFATGLDAPSIVADRLHVHL